VSTSPFGQPRAEGAFADDGPPEDPPAYPYDPVRASATALTWVAGLGILLNCLTCGGIVSMSGNRDVARPAGASSAPILEVCFTGMATLLVYPIMLAGAMQMMQRHGYWSANLAAILALLPCSLVCIAGLPIGIWALMVLSDPQVKASFR
jgi:hypothetical protein